MLIGDLSQSFWFCGNMVVFTLRFLNTDGLENFSTDSHFYNIFRLLRFFSVIVDLKWHLQRSHIWELVKNIYQYNEMLWSAEMIQIEKISQNKLRFLKSSWKYLVGVLKFVLCFLERFAAQYWFVVLVNPVIQFRCQLSVDAWITLIQISGVAKPKFWGGPKKFWGAKIFEFRRATAFLWDTASQSTKWLDMLKIWGGMVSWAPHGYDYDSNSKQGSIVVWNS